MLNAVGPYCNLQNTTLESGRRNPTLYLAISIRENSHRFRFVGKLQPYKLQYNWKWPVYPLILVSLLYQEEISHFILYFCLSTTLLKQSQVSRFHQQPRWSSRVQSRFFGSLRMLGRKSILSLVWFVNATLILAFKEEKMTLADNSNTTSGIVTADVLQSASRHGTHCGPKHAAVHLFPLSCFL